MFNEYAKYTAVTGNVTIDTANTGLDGGGTLGTVLTVSSSDSCTGCLVKTINIKGEGTVTNGMIRLFIYDGTNTRIIMEVPVINSTTGAFPVYWRSFKVNMFLQPGFVLKASTQKAERFSVIAEGLEFIYP